MRPYSIAAIFVAVFSQTGFGPIFQLGPAERNPPNQANPTATPSTCEYDSGPHTDWRFARTRTRQCG